MSRCDFPLRNVHGSHVGGLNSELTRISIIGSIFLLISICSHIGRFQGGFGKGRTASRHSITFNIYAKSQGVIDRFKHAVQQLCEKECPDVLLNSEEDHAAITKLTQVEVTYLSNMIMSFHL